MISAALVFLRDKARTGESLLWSSVSFSVAQSLTIQIRVSNVHIVNALIREAGGHLLSFLFNFKNQGKKAFDA